MIAPAALPNARRFWAIAAVLIAATLLAAVVLVDRVAEHQVLSLIHI